MMKSKLAKLKAKMPPAPGKDSGEEEQDMFSMPEGDEEEPGEPEAGETAEHEAGESAEFEAGEEEEMAEESGLPEGTSEEEAMETEEQHTSELSDDALLAEVKKRGLDVKKAGAPAKRKAVAVSSLSQDAFPSVMGKCWKKNYLKWTSSLAPEHFKTFPNC